MHKKIINTGLLVGLVLGLSFYAPPGYKDTQLKSSRVKEAYRSKWPGLQKLLAEKHLSPGDFDVYFRAFKQEGQLEVWAKNSGERSYQLLKTLRICAASGTPGPKRRQGDGQVPEGFYEIPSLNAYSSYHLSLRVGYPNKSDRLKASGDPGGDIMIHGNCVTIGCIPVEDDPIEELFVLCVEAKNRGRVIYTDIYPCRLTDKKLEEMTRHYATETLALWAGMKTAYAFFEKHHYRPGISTGSTGDYIIDTQTL